MSRLPRSPVVWFSLFLALYLAGRIAGPDDLNTKDQPRTVAYTVDMIQNGHWRTPVDMMGQPATKPPLYNWVAALPIAATGIYNTLLFKLPSLVAGLGCLGFLALFIGHLGYQDLPRPIPFAPVFWLAALAWLANPAVYGLIYTARPDMLLTFFLLAGWTISTLLMEQSPVVERHRRLWSLGLWLCVQAAILTKGTPALLVLLYIPLYSLIRFRALRPMLRTHVIAALPAVLLVTFLWFQTAWNDLPQSHKDLLVQMESARITGGGFFKGLAGLYKMPYYFLLRFVPWSLVFLWLFLHVHRFRLRTTPWTPVYLWFLLVLVFFSIPTFKRDDYLLPAYPVAALAAGYAVWTLPPWVRRSVVALASLLIAGAVAVDFWTKDHLIPRYGDNCARFAASVRAAVPQQARLVFFRTGYNNLQAFLGRNCPLSDPPLDSLRPGDFLLQPVHLLSEEQAKNYRFHGPDWASYQPVPPAPGFGVEQVLLSAPLSNVSGNKPGLVGLFRIVSIPARDPAH